MAETRLPLEQLLHFYQDMLRIRCFEETVRDEIHHKGLLHGSAHLYIGQEAVAVGSMHALQRDDYILSSYRGHGQCLAKGVDPERMFAEILGRRTGLCKGKGGSMHLSDRELDMLGENGVVAANIPIATGAALACKLQRSGRIVATFFGEGAVNAGVFHESLNLAGLWKLPIIFLCENNRYAISVSIDRASATTELHKRAESYDMPGVSVDGMDVIEVYLAVQEAARLAREQSQPSLLVFQAYRFEGHHLKDIGRYRGPEEITQMRREHDPIHQLEQELLKDCVLDPNEVADYRVRIRGEIEAAFQRAVAAPFPEPKEAWDDLYAPTEVSTP